MNEIINITEIESVENSLVPAFLEARENSIASARKIKSVESDPMQGIAVDVLGEIQTLIRSVEKSRVELKAKPLQLCKAIDAAARSGVEPLLAEEKRLKSVLGAYALAKEEEVKALERARQAEMERQAALQRIEEEKARAALLAKEKAEADARKAQEALEQAKTAKESQRLQEEAQQAEKKREEAIKAMAASSVQAVKAEDAIRASVPVVATKAEGSKTKIALKFEVTDIAAFFKEFPQYCDITVKKSLVNSLIATMELQSDEIPTIAGLRIFRDANVTTTSRR